MPDENSEVEPSVDNGSIEYEGEDEEVRIESSILSTLSQSLSEICEVEESEEESDEEETNDSKYAGTFYSIE